MAALRAPLRQPSPTLLAELGGWRVLGAARRAPHGALPGRWAGRVDGRTVICLLTHDPKFDVPVLEIALRISEIGYIGAMVSRKTHEERLQRLREAWLTEAEAVVAQEEGADGQAPADDGRAANIVKFDSKDSSASRK